MIRPAAVGLTACSVVLASLIAIAGVPQPGAQAEPLFVDAAESTGLDFTHVSGASGQYFIAEQMGAGVALFDYDNDGDLDVYLVQGGTLAAAAPAGNTARPAAMKRVEGKLFRNDLKAETGGRRTLRFTDVTDRAGVGWGEYGMGTAVGDYDNDGDLDLFLTSFGPDAMFRNNGDGTFTDVTAEAGVSDPLWSTSAAFLDYDRDGDLDLFVANYLDFTVADNKICFDPVGARDYCSPRVYRPVPDRLYRNEGNGRFTNVTEPAGNQPCRRCGSWRERRRLQRRRLARSLRRQRCDPQSALDQSPRRDVRGRRRALGGRAQCRGQS